MTDRRQFRTDYPRGPIIPTGELLNAQGSALNAAVGGFGGGGAGYNGLANQGSVPPGVLIGTAKITDASNSGGLVDGEVDAPNKQNNKYLCEFRFWNAGAQVWQTHDIGCNRLDAGAYHNGTPGGGSIPLYEVGDVVPVWFDAQRNWLVPMHSPPEQTASYVFRGREDVEPEKTKHAPYADSVNVCLEVRRGGNWFCYLPELTLTCGGRYKSGMSASMPLVVALRHYDQLRMRCGTHLVSSGRFNVYEHGLRIIPLCRLNPGQSPGVGAMQPAYQSLTMLKGLQQVTVTRNRWSDSPVVSPYEDGLRVEFTDPFAQWMVAIDYWAEMRQSYASGAFLRVAHEDKADGALLDAVEISNDVFAHPSGLMKYEGGTWNIGPHAYLQFVDYQGDNFNVIAEQGRIYGPCQLVGELAVDETDEPDRPLYLCAIGDQEYLAKTVSLNGTVAKGDSEAFQLYSRSEEPQGITVMAKAQFGSITRGKWCIVKRLNRVWYASQVECD